MGLLVEKIRRTGFTFEVFKQVDEELQEGFVTVKVAT